MNASEVVVREWEGLAWPIPDDPGPLTPANVSCTIPTRGNVDMEPVLATLPYDDIVVWDNSQREDLGPYARFAAMAECKHDIIYTQDDDLLFHNHQALLDLYRPGVVAVNYQEPWDIPWHGRGAVFHRDLPGHVFELYEAHFPADHEYRKHYADAIFSLLTDAVVADLGYEDLPYGFGPGRLSTSPGWYDGYRPEAKRRADYLRALRG